MKTISSHEASERFDDYAREAHSGEQILITMAGRPWVILTSAPATAPGRVEWPTFAQRLAGHHSEPMAGPTATELLAEDKEDRF